MFPLLQDVHQLHNGIIITIKLLLPFSKLFFPLRETDKLLQSLFVDMAVLLELSVGLVKFLPKLRAEDKTKFTHAHRFNSLPHIPIKNGYNAGSKES